MAVPAHSTTSIISTTSTAAAPPVISTTSTDAAAPPVSAADAAPPPEAALGGNEDDLDQEVSVIPFVTAEGNTPAQSVLGEVMRIVDLKDRTVHDAEADMIAADTAFYVILVDPKDANQDYCSPFNGAGSIEHLSLHLPKLKGCSFCDEAKHVHEYKLRRKKPMLCICGQDALDRPFGALLHMDWLQMRKGSRAFTTAQRALIMTDDLTSYLGAAPADSKTPEVVIEAVHHYDEAVPEVRRWWTDRASEFLSAVRHIRSIRPLAHYTSVPWRHAPKAERTNRTTSDGTRAALIQSCLSESWWVLALLHWISQWNGFVIGKDGLPPYRRRHGEDAPHKQYPFGALVLLHPHRPPPRIGEPQHSKWQSCLDPAILVKVTIGPVGKWAHSYGVVLLTSFTSSRRPSTLPIRRSCDIVFPETVNLPLRQAGFARRSTG